MKEKNFGTNTTTNLSQIDPKTCDISYRAVIDPEKHPVNTFYITER